MTAPTTGRHWLLDLQDCSCEPELLRHARVLEARCVALATQAGMQVVGSRFHQFEPEGVTGVVLLAESHLSIHTWPEFRFAAVDIYICNHEHDNTAKADTLATLVRCLLGPRASKSQKVARGAVAAVAA